ncbi:hypothetical protein D3C73_1122540 [compost metagenome]
MDHLLGQLDDPHRLAHVQDKDITALSHGARLDHQLCRFRDGHEVSSDLRMRDRQRTARLDLFVKQRNDRTRRSQDITKPHHREARFVHTGNIARITEQHRGQFTAQRLQRQLGKALGATHDIGWSHGLVGGNQDKVGHPCLERGLGRIEGAYHIIEHAFGNVVFDHGDMLVGRGVIHRVYSPGFHDIQ